MVVQPPFLYDPVKTEGPRSPYKEFDPKAVTRASFQTTRSKPRPESQGPLISFNQHPDSYYVLPYENKSVMLMSPSVKTWIKWVRIIQLVLRVIEMLCAAGQLTMMILITNTEAYTGWIMRIAPGVATLHTVYGIYHLARKPSGRTPGSSASYMLFASFFDVSIIPFYAFAALVAWTRSSDWKTLVSDTSMVETFTTIVFYLAAVGGGLHLISLGISLYLAVIFRKINQLPPDMNPLEDNLTSRHKRNKSSMSTATTVMSETEKRLSAPLESNRSSGAAYEDLSRPPTIPFFHTRTQSNSSFSTYQSSSPSSRDSRQDLASRQYQIRPDSSRSSLAATELKRASYYGQTSPTKNKRTTYTEVPTNDSPSQRSGHPLSDAWFTTNSLTNSNNGNNKGGITSPRKGTQYQALHQRYDSTSDLGDHPHPLFTNPPTPQHTFVPTGRDQALASLLGSNPPKKTTKNENLNTGDITDIPQIDRDSTPQRNESTLTREAAGFKAKYYGELRPGTPPVMIGRKGGDRQVSSGNDYDFGLSSSAFTVPPREVSGKVAEEGRADGWGTRLRRISGMKQ